METQNFKLIENYRGYSIFQKSGETLFRVFAENDVLLQTEIGGYSKLESAKRKIENLTENMADRPASTGSAPAEPTSPQHDKAKAMSIEKIREKCQDIDALFLSRDNAKNVLRKLTLMRNADKEIGNVLCQFTNTKANDADKTVSFAFHATELIDRAIEIANRSLDAVEFAIMQAERKGV